MAGSMARQIDGKTSGHIVQKERRLGKGTTKVSRDAKTGWNAGKAQDGA
jgi:hypothetical protein